MNEFRTKPLCFRPILAGTAMLAAALLNPPAGLAQAPSDQPGRKGGIDNDILKAREQELAAIRAEQQRAAESEIRLRAEIEAFGNDRRKLNTDLIGTAARLREVEQVVAVHGLGFLLGIEFNDKAAPIHQALLEQKIITSTSSNPKVLRLLPPLCLRKEHVDLFVEKLNLAVDKHG